MGVIRINKTKNYTVMSNYHLEDTRLSLKAIGLLSKMLSLRDDWEYSINGLVSICKEGKDAVMSALDELEAAGYIIRTQCHDANGRFAGVQYNIFEVPQTLENTEVEPYAENPNTVNPNTENPTQLNTNILNTNNSMYESKAEPEPQHERQSYQELIDSMIQDPNLKNAIWEFIKMRCMKNNRPTNYALKLLIKSLMKQTQSVDEQILIVEEAIMGGYAKFILKPKEQTTKGTNKFNNFNQRDMDFKELEQKMLGIV